MATFAELKKDFNHLVKTGRLSHGYIIFGPGINNEKVPDEKFRLARELAEELEHCEKDKSLLDAMIIDARSDSGIDNIRAAIRFLWKKPVNSSRRTLIIQHSDQLTRYAEQAILKTAEEPPPHGLIIMTAPSLEGVTAPLVSRLQKIFLSSGGESTTKTVFTKQAADFCSADQKQRALLIKEVISDNQLTRDFMNDMILIAAKNRVKNVRLLRDLLDCLRVISEYNTNKRLQLESVLLNASF
jgi:hypothetical protein